MPSYFFLLLDLGEFQVFQVTTWKARARAYWWVFKVGFCVLCESVFLFHLTIVSQMDTSSKNPTCRLHNSCMGKNGWDLLALLIALRGLCFLMCLLHKGENRSSLLPKSLVCISDTSWIKSCCFSLNVTEHPHLYTPHSFLSASAVLFVGQIVLSQQLWLGCPS